MKKLSVILLLFVYGFTASGMSVQLHYCCGKLKSIDFFSTEKRDCGMTHKMGSKPCCETKQVTNKEKSDQLNMQTAAIKLLMTSIELTKSNIVTDLQAPPTFVAYSFTDTSPPPAAQPIFVRNCVFRI